MDEASILLHQANICIENAILADLGTHVEQSGNWMSEAFRQLSLFRDKVEEVVRVWDGLLEKVQKLGYKGNPLTPQVCALKLDRLFEGTLLQPRIMSPVWQDLVSRIASENLIPTFQWERDMFRQLHGPVERLLGVLETCRSAALKGKLVDQVEGNRIPLRQYFGAVFSGWYYVSCVFLYSAMICTELFYRANGLGSLAEPGLVSEGERTPA